MITFTIRGTVQDEAGLGVAGQFVKAYDRDLLFDDLLGSALTDEHGRFDIVSEPGDFRDFFEARPGLYFRIYRADRTTLVHSTERGVTWNVRSPVEVEIVVPSDRLYPPEAAVLRLTGDAFEPEEPPEAGESLQIAAEGLRPRTAYAVIVRSEGAELFSTRLLTNGRGQIEPTVLWPQLGMDDPRADARPTYQEARQRWQGATLQVVVHTEEATALEGQIRLADRFTRPLVLSADSEGRLMNSIEQGQDGLFLGLHNLPFTGQVRIYMVPRQHDWRNGDPFEPAILADGTPAIRDVALEQDHQDALVAVASADVLPVGAFDFIVRPLRYGYEEDDELRVLASDVLSGRRITGVVVREPFRTGKPVLGGCVNKVPVSGRTVVGAPYFQFTDTFHVGESVYAALDPGIMDPGNITKMCAFYVVQSKTDAQWNVDNSLMHLPVLGGNPAVTKIKVQSGCINANTVLVWPNATQVGEYDIVADFGNNTPDASLFVPDDAYDTPLDVIDGYFVAGFRVVQDPGTMTDPGLFAGTWNYTESDVAAMGMAGTVAIDDENGFYATPGAFSVLTRQVQLKAHVCFPADAGGITDPAQISGSKPDYPLVVIVHGNGQDYTAYDFLLQHWARNGFVAASIDNRYLSGGTLVHGMHGLGRANNLFQHLAVLKAEFGAKIQNNVGIMGHSRGGEAVVKVARLNQQQGLGVNINAVLSLAPTDQYGKEVLAGAYATPFFVLYGSRDGDVAGWYPWGAFDWRTTGFSLYDRAAGAGKSMAYVYKATHNGFITTNYDNPADSPLPPATQQAITKAYATAFFRWHLRGEPEWGGMFTGQWKPASVGATGAEVYVQYRAPGGKTVDDFEGPVANWQASTIGGTVSEGGTLPVLPSEARLFDFGAANPGLDSKSPHDSKGLKVQWNNVGDRLTWTIPSAHRDVSGFGVLSLRVTQKEASSSNVPNQAQDLRVTLKDSANNQRAIRVGAFGAVPYPDQRANADLRKSAMATIRIPLTAYTIVCAGQVQVDLQHVTELSLDFSLKATGEIEVDDIEFTT